MYQNIKRMRFSGDNYEAELRETDNGIVIEIWGRDRYHVEESSTWEHALSRVNALLCSPDNNSVVYA